MSEISKSQITLSIGDKEHVYVHEDVAMEYAALAGERFEKMGSLESDVVSQGALLADRNALLSTQSDKIGELERRVADREADITSLKYKLKGAEIVRDDRVRRVEKQDKKLEELESVKSDNDFLGNAFIVAFTVALIETVYIIFNTFG